MWFLMFMCLVPKILFQALLKTLEQVVGDIFERVQAGIWEPQYSTACIAELANSEKYWVSLPDMSRFGELLPAVIDVRTQKNILWSAVPALNIVRTVKGCGRKCCTNRSWRRKPRGAKTEISPSRRGSRNVTLFSSSRYISH